MAIDFDIVERVSRVGPDSTLVKVEYRPVPNELVHSNLFRMQLYPTSIRIVVDRLGRRLTESGIFIAPDADHHFPDENPDDPYQRETVARNNDLEIVRNIEEYWERKLQAAAAGKPYPRHHNTTLNLQVGASSDDARELVSDGTMTLVVADTAFGSPFGGPFHQGLRWTGVSGLSGSTIDSAVLTFRANATDSGDFVANWFAHDVESPGTFTTTASNISDTAQRPRTTATVGGDGSDFGNWTSGNDETFTGDGVNTIADIIQELADSFDPTEIVLIHIYTSGTGEREADAFDAAGENSARLDIDFTEPGAAVLGAVQLDTNVLIGRGRMVGY